MTSYRFPPGPPRSIFSGNSRNVDVHHVYKSLYDHRDKYGSVSHVRLGGNDIISLNTVDAVREAFLGKETSEILTARPVTFQSVYVYTDDVIAQSPTDIWHARKCAFHKGIQSTQSLPLATDEVMDEELSQLKASLRDSNASPFDPYNSLNKSVINCAIIGLIGRRFHYDHDIFGQYEALTKNGIPLYVPVNRVILQNLPSIRHLPFWLGKNYHQIKSSADGVATHLFEDVEKESENSGEKSGIIYEMLKAKEIDGSISYASIKSIILDTFVGNILPMFASLNSLVYQLLHNPAVQCKIQNEIDSVVGINGKLRIGHMTSMPYTEAVIWESHRWTATLPSGIARCNSEDVSLFDHFLPKGTLFLPNVWRIQHDEELWEEPWVFKPERFLDNDGKLLPSDHPNRRNVILFGVGGRACIGQTWANTRLFLYLVTLCQAFHIYNDNLGPDSKANPWDYHPVGFFISPPKYLIQLKERM